MTETHTFDSTAFKSRTLSLVRNFVGIYSILKGKQTVTFNLSGDPFDMKFNVFKGHLFTAVDINDKQGNQRKYSIASIDHTERLLYMVDMNKTQSELMEEMKKEFKDEFFLYLLEEYITTDVFSVPAEEMEDVSSGNAHLIGHIEQLHIIATTINKPDASLVSAMYELTALMNKETPTMEDFENFKNTVEAL